MKTLGPCGSGSQRLQHPALVMRDIAANLRVARIEIKRPRLEDVFVRLVAGHPDDAASLLSELAKPDAREAAE